VADTLTEKCANRLRREIMAGDLQMRDGILNESALCKRFKVSRITVRRSLAQLRDENLLLSIPYKGYVLGPAAYVGQHRGSGGKNTATRILFAQSPDSRPLRDSLHERLIWEGMQEEAARHKLQVDQCRLPLRKLISEVSALRGKSLLGVALEWYNRNVAEALLSEGIPTVLVENHIEGMLQDSVMQDDDNGVGQCIDHLWKLGHRRIGLIVWSYSANQPQRRRAAFSMSLLKHGVVERARLGTSARFDAEGGREAAKMLLDSSSPPTAILIAHLEMAAGVFAELEARKLHPGKNVSVICWGTPALQASILHGTQYANTPLDLVEWQREEMGRLAVRILLARHIDPLIPAMRVQVGTKLTLRGSTSAV
jgi:DNA-binding LacI/PurR family transcriptional regulator